MKKSVLLIIAVIYILSVVVVGRRIKTEVYKPIEYVTEIEILNDEYEYYSDYNRVGDFDGKIILDYKEGLVYELKCRAYPYDSTSTLLTYIFDEKSNICSATVTKDNTLILEFKKKGPFPVIVKSSDGGDVQVQIYIEAQKDII